MDYCSLGFDVQVAKVFCNAVGVDVVGVTDDADDFDAFQAAFF